MSTRKQKNDQLLSQAIEASSKSAGLSLKGVLEKLPNWALVPGAVILFGLLLTDTVVVDPLPFVDEAALLYAFMSSLNVLNARRKRARELRQIEAELLQDPTMAIDVDFEELPERTAPPGQPLTVPAS